MQTLRASGPLRSCKPSRPVFTPVPVRTPVCQGRQRTVTVFALKQWPDPEFIKETLAQFPDKGIATVEEARCLFSNGGYTWLDVRSELENDEVGKVKGSVNIPFVHLKRVYDPETKERVMKKTPNPDFIKMVEKRFPKKDVKLMVGCSNGKAYSIDALEALEEAGYTNLTFVRGGYNAWFRVFDNKFNRRNYGEYQERYDGHDQLSMGDSCGIHASGAGFDKVDKADRWSLPVY
ncbi:gonidia-specific protein KA_k47 [Volvox carteri f. nagariensis]|uniref:Gonidia-specific protein KA_k47 n=1 Tax=Volvox carteri f. nagariensis TaxID=3068 RepID=D8U4T3_VOLCA|nr:gonidia-specific protein KA_k47 [Volvox carteri f. nagariensis]EFJ45243.1 gonidia-specific protein KA_k47 [Volvox carteri f. nagariensis]|eukprot:XP_002953619.1 gonidia-specific protein KA_k47 [Volvox carteri f. nagariensis]